MSALLSLPIVLPSYAGSRPAEETTIQVPLGADPLNLEHVVDSRWVEVIIRAQCVLATDATVGNRSMTFIIVDPSGNVVMIIPSTTTQPASTNYRYAWESNISGFFAPLATDQHMPLPLVPLTGGSRVLMREQNGIGGVYQQTALTIIRFPTGPVEERSEAPIVTPRFI